MGLKDYVQSRVKSTDEEIRAKNGARRPRKVLVIGWNTGPTDEYIQLLRGNGVNVFWVGQDIMQQDYNNIFANIKKTIDEGRHEEAAAMVDMFSTSMKNRPDLAIEKLPGYKEPFVGPMGPCPVPCWNLNFRSLLGVIGSDWDLVLQFQNWIKWVGADGQPDVEKSPIPFVYYFSEPFYPVVPRVAWHVVGSSPQMMELAKDNYGNAFMSYQNVPWACRFGVLDSVERNINEYTYDVTKRPVKASFCGKIHSYQFYEERKDIVMKVEAELGEDFEGHWVKEKGEIDQKTGYMRTVPERGKGQLNIIDYTKLLMRSKFGLNVNTQWGANFRDFEVPACGGILLTKERSDMKGLGFREGENVMYYRTPEEAAEIAKMEPEPEIALAGYQLVVNNHTYARRVKDLITIMEKCL